MTKLAIVTGDVSAGELLDIGNRGIHQSTDRLCLFPELSNNIPFLPTFPLNPGETREKAYNTVQQANNSSNRTVVYTFSQIFWIAIRLCIHEKLISHEEVEFHFVKANKEHLTFYCDKNGRANEMSFPWGEFDDLLTRLL